jgi:hypothetical protein
LTQQLFVVPRELGRGCKCVDNRRIESLFEQRQQLGTNPIPRNPQVIVGFVVQIAVPVFLEKRLNIAPRTVEHRANGDARARIHGRETACSGTSQQPEQKRFCLIVARVPQRDCVGVLLVHGALEEAVADNVSCVFDRAALGDSNRTDVRFLEHERTLERRCQLCTESRVVVCSGTELVIDVSHRHERQRADVVQGGNGVHEGDRIRAAREGDDQPGLRTCECFPLERSPNTIDQRHGEIVEASVGSWKSEISAFDFAQGNHERSRMVPLDAARGTLSANRRVPEGGLEPPTPRL